MSAFDPSAIAARALAATPGAVVHSYEGTTRGEHPRHQHSICNGTWQDEDARPHKCIAMVYADSEEDTADAVFFANARADVFALLRHIAQANDRIVSLRSAIAAERAAMGAFAEAQRDTSSGCMARLDAATIALAARGMATDALLGSVTP